MVVLYRPWTLMVGCPSGESGDEGGVGVVPVGGEVVEGGLNVDGLPQHKDVDHDSERVELVFLPDLIVLAELAAVAVEHVARQAVPGLTAVEQVVIAALVPRLHPHRPPGPGRIAWHGWSRSRRSPRSRTPCRHRRRRLPSPLRGSGESSTASKPNGDARAPP